MFESITSRISIRVSLPPLISMLVLFTVIALSIIAYLRSEAAARQFAQQNLTLVHERIRDRLADHFQVAERINRVNREIIASGRLDVNDLPAWRTILYEEMKAFDSISTIVWGDEAGGATFISRYPGMNGYRYGLRYRDQDSRAREYAMDADGGIGPEPLHEYEYHPRERPWYRAAVTARRPTWAEVYQWSDKPGRNPVLSAPYVSPVFNAAGVLQGVIDVEFSLYDLSRFLETLSIGESGLAFIMNNDGVLVASSTGTRVFDPAGGRRMHAREIREPLISQPADIVAGRFAASDTIDHSYMDSLQVYDTRVLLMASPIRRDGDLNWLVVTLVPEEDFLAEFRTGRRDAMKVAIVAMVIAVVLGITVAGYLARPILRLAEHVQRIGNGELDQKIVLHEFPELVRLSRAINRMAAGLKERLALRESLAMAMEVQQRLLPAATPDIAGLDISGHSNYCDETGGDYYDFLRIDAMPDDTAVVAIGDVSGHGIASAMVMASARGILRSRSHDAGSLAELLAHMNVQITEDSSGGRFMTMMLLAVSGQRREMRWASAGHREPLVYDPGADAFSALQGADVPLGITPDAAYREWESGELRPGHIIVLATDGVWEAANPGGEVFGMERVEAVVRRHAGRDAAGICSELAGAIDRHRAGAPQGDDITFVIVRIE